MTNYFKKQLGVYSFCFLVSVAVLAEDRRIIYATQMPTPEDHISQNFSESCEVDSEHCNRNVEGALQPKLSNDMSALANSVEFETYKFNDMSASKTTFLSPAGICNGFKSDNGVNVTNSSNYYIKPNDASEYYGSVLGATIYQKGETKTLQYVPVYAIKNENIVKYIEQNEEKNVRNKAHERIQEGRKALNEVVCN